MSNSSLRGAPARRIAPLKPVKLTIRTPPSLYSSSSEPWRVLAVVSGMPGLISLTFCATSVPQTS